MPARPDMPSPSPLSVNGSVTVGLTTFSTDKTVTANGDIPNVGASIDVKLGDTPPGHTEVGSIGAGLGKHAGVDATVAVDPKGQVEVTALTLHVGAATPTSPVHISTPGVPLKMSDEFKWELRANATSALPPPLQ